LSRDSELNSECFGPAGVAVGYRSNDEVLQLLDSDEGMLVGCLHAEEDEPEAVEIAEVLGRRAGRVVWNGWPTGVAVSGAQMHGGPYPAATVPGATSVGLHAVMRFVRPVVWQSFPPGLLR
jgi:NAD-dependent aldehyde dehydrogenases